VASGSATLQGSPLPASPGGVSSCGSASVSSVPLPYRWSTQVYSQLRAGAGIMPREKIILGCTECKNRNYFVMKNKRLHPERVEWKKYCPRCNKHQTHKETK
jgi:large subunit ribosomal protein L33